MRMLRIGAVCVVMCLLVAMPLAYAVGTKSGSISGAGTVYTSSFSLSSPGSYALKAGIRVMLKPQASYRTVTLVTTLQKNNGGSYVNVENFSKTLQKAGISNTSTTQNAWFPGENSYTNGSTGSTMITSGTYRYKEFAYSSVSDSKYVTYYNSQLN